MTAILADAVRTGAWSLGVQKKGQFAETASLKVNGEVAQLQLVPSSEPEAVYIPFEPSVFKGTGDEVRKTMVLQVPHDVAASLQALEERAKDMLKAGGACGDIESIWHSGIKEDQFGASVRVKIWLQGSQYPCRFFNEEGQIAAPESLAGLYVVPIVRSSVYVQSKIAGLLHEVVALKITGRKQKGVNFL